MAAPQRDTRTARRFRRRAYHHIRAALAEGRERVPSEWLARGDPDLESLRAAQDEEWQLLVQRYSTEPETPLRGSPERPWGSPAARMRWWLVAAAVAGPVAVALAILLDARWLPIVAGVVWALAVPQIWRANQERKVARESERLVTELVPAQTSPATTPALETREEDKLHDPGPPKHDRESPNKMS